MTLMGWRVIKPKLIIIAYLVDTLWNLISVSEAILVCIRKVYFGAKVTKNMLWIASFNWS